MSSGGTPVSLSIPFASEDFNEISAATAEELARVINADPDAQTNGIVASAVDGALVLQTAGGGAGASFTIDGGAAADNLGWTGLVGVAIDGQDNAVDVRLGGVFQGDADTTYTFRPNMDGVIGTTAGLTVEVLNEKGELVAELDVGPGYVPGTELSVADGVTVTFGLGELSASHGDLFASDMVADSDSTDVLVALGLNGLFEGSNASDIEVNPEIARDPGRLASAIENASGDNSLLLELLNVQDDRVEGLENASIGAFYNDIVSDLGFEVASAQSALGANGAVLQSLEERRSSISGVNVDEELVDLVAFEQAFQAAAQYINTINQLGDEILALL